MVEIKNQEDILQLVREDPWMMDILRTVKSLNLPDWWVCAGFVRSKIWDALHGFNERTPLPDIDVVYFDRSNIDEREEKKHEQNLKAMSPNIPWSVKNQARMHAKNGKPPYTSSTDAISKFPETATALGLSLTETNQLLLTAPCGVEDVLDLQIKPTSYFLEHKELAGICEERILKKDWKATWDKLRVFHIGDLN